MAKDMDVFKDILSRNRGGERKGIAGICSSHPMVIDAAIEQSLEDEAPLLIESTSNQVDQFGGYTGMKPADFSAFIQNRLDAFGFERKRLILGGDHLGPNRWQDRPAAEAMELACGLVGSYVDAGYRKIHLDASMPCADDWVGTKRGITEQVVAKRAARLCRAAEVAYRPSSPTDEAPLYIIGTEVPIPGGAKDQSATIQPTTPEEAINTYEITREAFLKEGIGEAWERVVGMVVQPGVEFGNNWVSRLEADKLEGLSKVAVSGERSFVYEAHSTDYQDGKSLEQLVNSHFAILKVGPWLTFIMRQTLYALAFVEANLLGGAKGVKLSNLMEVVDVEMLADPKDWVKHCHGDNAQLHYERQFGLSDRIRYYLGRPNIEAAVRQLFANCRSMGLPLGLISQYLPEYYPLFREGWLSLGRPEEVARHAVRDVIRLYHVATGFRC